ACFKGSVIVGASFAPSFLMEHGHTLAEAGFLTGVALWISIVAVPLGGFIGDRTDRPRLLILAGCLATAVTLTCVARAPLPAFWLVVSGVLAGLPPSIMMALLPQAVRAEHLATALGVF